MQSLLISCETSVRLTLQGAIASNDYLCGDGFEGDYPANNQLIMSLHLRSVLGGESYGVVLLLTSPVSTHVVHM